MSHMQPMRFKNECVACTVSERNSISFLWKLYEIDSLGNYIDITVLPFSSATGKIFIIILF